MGSQACVFCGSEGSLTREHVLSDWLSKIGLADEPVEHFAGPLNRISKSMGVRKPFSSTVKSVCASCNNGWMSRLETLVQPVLTPIILGESARIAPADQAAVAMWLQKTALMSLLVSSSEDREDGYGLPPEEYRLLYEQSEALQPPLPSMFWVASYAGPFTLGSMGVTPLAINVKGLPEPNLPDAYAMTLTVGALLLHGVKFTHLPYFVDVRTALPLEDLWPTDGDVQVDGRRQLEGMQVAELGRGKHFVVRDRELTLRPWKPATELDESNLVGSMVELPALCGKHVTYYPAVLVEEAQRGRFYWFITTCACDLAYLVHTESDGAHTKSHGTFDKVAAQYASLPGRQRELRSGDAVSKVKADAERSGR
jgi:hypothetical protein